MSREFERLNKCVACVRAKTDFKPKIALVLGSGLGALADEIDIVKTVDYHEIDGFPVSTIIGHKGRYVFGYIEKIPIVIMQGRVHFYEGYSMQDVVLPIRLMRMLGAEILLLTNSAGSLNPEYRAGDFMVLTDHISTFVPSPLIGENVDELGERFPDMSEVYSKKLREIFLRSAEKVGVKLREGVYVQLTGPQFETPHEIKMCRLIGGDAVGMSTVCEAIAAKHCGFSVGGVSCISNLGCGLSDRPLSHSEVHETAKSVSPIFKKFIRESIIEMSDLI